MIGGGMMHIYELWFMSANISNESKIELIKKYNNEENIYNNIEALENEYIFKGKEYSRLKETTMSSGAVLIENLNKNEISYVTIRHKEYPESLRNIYNPPYVLFYKGDLSLVNTKTIAIVGSRRSSAYGEEVTRQIVNELSTIPYTIVSGLAYGIDSVAHKMALSNQCKTIAVLGCGIDIIYPSSNKGIYKEIENCGLLLSEFLPGTPPLAQNFPRRNRIISGLSGNVIVVEGSIKSGSMITASYALEQGKGVMAVPGLVLNENSKGCNLLIRDGAMPFTEKEDLYIFLNEIKNSKAKMGNNPTKKRLMEIISEEPIHLDKIIKCVNVDRIALFELLFEMQNTNEIISLPGNYYARLS